MHLKRTLKQPLHEAKVPLMRRKEDVVGESFDVAEVSWFPNTIVAGFLPGIPRIVMTLS
jgi:hypothetical protein